MQPETLFLIQTIALAIMLGGLLGLIIPIFPGLLVIWLAVLGYGIATGFQWWSVLIFVIITLLAVAGSLADNLLIGAKALQKGASWLSLGIATLAGIAGSILFPPFGGLPAAVLAVLVFEYSRHRDWDKAVQLTKGMAAGWGIAFVIRFAIGLTIISLWALWAVFLT
jgi:uncharacterized protein YqgC (DUF456 family)